MISLTNLTRSRVSCFLQHVSNDDDGVQILMKILKDEVNLVSEAFDHTVLEFTDTCV